MYSMTALVSYEPYVHNCIRLLRVQFNGFAASDRSIGLAHWFQCYAFGVIEEIPFGERFGFLDKGEDTKGLVKALDSGYAYSRFVGLFRWLGPLLALVLGFLGNDSVTYIQKFSESKVAFTKQERLGTVDNGPMYMAKKLIHAQGREKRGLTDKDVPLTAWRTLEPEAIRQASVLAQWSSTSIRILAVCKRYGRR